MNYYNEWDKTTAKWLEQLIKNKLIPNGVVDTRSIAEVTKEDLNGYTQCHFFAGIGGWSRALQLAGWSEDKSVWTGSPPCQAFSVAGSRRGTEDERHLWPIFFKLIQECRPDTIFGEQVSAAIRFGWLDGVYSDLEREEYTCGSVVLGAHSVGSPNIRQRLYWCGKSNRGVADSEQFNVRRNSGTTFGKEKKDEPKEEFQRQSSRDKSLFDGSLFEKEILSEWRDWKWIGLGDGKFRRIPVKPSFRIGSDGLPDFVGSGGEFK